MDGETTECAARFLRRRRRDGVSSHFDRKGVRPGTAGQVKQQERPADEAEWEQRIFQD